MTRALPLLLLLACASARADEATPTPPLHTVTAGPLQTGCEKDGALRTAGLRRVIVRLEAYDGRLEVAHVGTALRAGGRVAKGEQLLVIRADDLDERLRAAREGAAVARTEVTQLEAEGKVADAAAALALEQARAGARTATRALERYKDHQAPLSARQRALGQEQQKNGLADQREELQQLEALYRGTQLAPDTKEIVLERARRDVRVQEQGLELRKAADALEESRDHPDRLDALEKEAKWTAAALARLEAELPLAAARRAQALAAAKRALRDADERLQRLEADQGRLTLSAPIDGVLERTTLRRGDLVGRDQVVATVHDESAYAVEVTATEEDLRYLVPGKKVGVALPGWPEVDLEGTVRDVALVGEPGAAGATEFAVRVMVTAREGAELLRVGLRCRVTATGDPVRRALAVPRNAVTTREGRHYVKVWTGSRAQELEVILGQGSREAVHVLSGLVAGDQVVLP